MSSLTHCRLAAIWGPFRHSRARQVIRLMNKWLLPVSVSVALTACNSSATSNAAPTPHVVATFWTAELIGELVQIEGCLRVNDRNSDTSYLLVWPPDLAATIEGDTIRVVSGIVTGNQREAVLHIGTLVYLGGGETTHLDEQLQQTVPANCQGPYWVVGNEVRPIEATKESE